MPTAAHRWPLLLFWALACAYLLWIGRNGIAAMAMPDSDDAMRLLQVRDWLAGQSWFDLNQYRLAPPAGADIHWTRLTDLPLAAFILVLKPLLGQASAEQGAAIVVPLLTLLCAMALIASLVRRWVSPLAWWWGPLLLMMASPALGMMVPLRIDHHGWQIVGLFAMIWGLTHPDRRKGGLAAGLAIAASLAIGVELLPLLMVGLGAAALAWVDEPDERTRLRCTTAAAALAATLALVVFIPPDARGVRCDALSAAWLLPLLVGGAALFGATLAPAGGIGQRLALVIGAGAVAALPLLGPTGACLADPYQAVDPEARRLWLGIVAEALPLFSQTIEVALATLVLPAIGLAGALTMLRRARGNAAALKAWAILLALSFGSIALALAQTRSAVAAQALAIPGAAALGHIGRERLATNGSLLVRVFGSVLLFLCVGGLLPRLLIAATLGKPPTSRAEAEDKATAACMAPAALARFDALPKGVVLITLDATPALLLHSRQSGVAGPYHRNGAAIAAVMRAWTGDDAAALATIHAYHVAYVAICGAPAEGAFYRKRGPNGFYARLARGRVPSWLAPRPITGSPWRVWRVSGRPLAGGATAA